MTLEIFKQQLDCPDVVAKISSGVIGDNVTFSTPFGEQKMVYADYTASGRALQLVESFVAEHVLPFYANSHTEASYCGAYTTRLREEARGVISGEVNAGDSCSVIFTGSGATAAINRALSLCGAGKPDAKPIVFIGPYEHHSNILPWRECGAEVIEIAESTSTGVDLDVLEAELKKRSGKGMLIGSFSAASNVTGILTDVDAVTKLLKKYDALAFWDYAGGAPYLTIDMNPSTECTLDAVFISPHKFPGGPGASGLLIVRNSIIKNTTPTWPGGGSVAYVSPWGHDYLDNVCEREEAGTPNIVGDIRAALVFMVKSAIGQEFITKQCQKLVKQALDGWAENPHLNVLAGSNYNRVPIFSFIVYDESGKHYHHGLATQILSDATGIQARGGCACAGPYGHRLLDVDFDRSEKIRGEINKGCEIEKPGWVRLNLSYLFDEKKVSYIIDRIDRFPSEIAGFAKRYSSDRASTKFTPVTNQEPNTATL